MPLILWNKRYTETLSQMLLRFRSEQPLYKYSKITYAGRLDPLAEGLMLLLTDQDTHTKESFLGLDKEYTVQCVLGAKTDTFDILGIPEEITNLEQPLCETARINTALKKIANTTTQEYPVFSSKTVLGKPLWLWAREGRIKEINIPKRDISVYDIQCIKSGFIAKDDFKESIKNIISNIEGDFRQKKIQDSWRNTLKKTSIESFQLLEIVCRVSSGTYVRGLVHSLGTILGCGGVCLKIKRNSIGDYYLKDIDK
jgi:tRNA pseudouridine55 synthase